MNAKNFCRSLASMVVVFTCPLAAQQPVGGEFPVSAILTAVGQQSAVEVAPDGSFVVVWNSSTSTGTDSHLSSIQARRFSASGASIGAPFQVNTYTTGAQVAPAVAIDADGEFLVVWSSNGSPGDDFGSYSVQAQRYEADGDPMGGQFQLNSYTTGRQDGPHAAYLSTGEFVVVWSSGGSAGTDTAPSYSVQMRRFDTVGAPVAPELQVNSYTTGNQRGPNVGIDGSGAFVVVWGGSNSPDPGETFGVVARRVDSGGTPIGNDFPANSYTTGGQFGAEVAVRANGSFVVAWTSAGSFGSDNSGYSIQGRSFDAAATPLAPEFQVNSYTTLTQNNASLELDAAGGFLVTWQSLGSALDDQQLSVQARSFNVSSSPAGPDFQANSNISGEQRQPRLGANGTGAFVVVWEDDPAIAFGSGPVSIRGQRFRSGLLSDGFESGDTSGWSSTVP